MEASEAAAAKAKADEERAAKAAAREEAKAAKAKEREEAKAAKAAAAEETKAAKVAESIAKAVAEVEWDGETPTFETLAEARDAVKTRKAEIRAAKPKKASLTLSQRRAMLRLQEGEIVPKTDFNALPFLHLVSVGLAEEFDGSVEVTVKKTVEKEVEIPKAEREEGGPTTKTVKEKVDETETREAKGFRLTEAGVERAAEINPKWKDWKPEGAGTTAV